MLIVALVLAVIGLAALVTAVVTSNAVVAWVCIGASVLGVVLLIVDAIRERQRGEADNAAAAASDTDTAESGEAIDATYQNFDAEYPDEDPATQVIEDGPASEDLAELSREDDTEPDDTEPDDTEPDYADADGTDVDNLESLKADNDNLETSGRAEDKSKPAST